MIRKIVIGIILFAVVLTVVMARHWLPKEDCMKNPPFWYRGTSFDCSSQVPLQRQ